MFQWNTPLPTQYVFDMHLGGILGKFPILYSEVVCYSGTVLLFFKHKKDLKKWLAGRTCKSESKCKSIAFKSKSKSESLEPKSKSKSKSSKKGLKSGLESKSGLEYYKSGQTCHDLCLFCTTNKCMRSLKYSFHSSTTSKFGDVFWSLYVKLLNFWYCAKARTDN